MVTSRRRPGACYIQRCGQDKTLLRSEGPKASEGIRFLAAHQLDSKAGAPWNPPILPRQAGAQSFELNFTEPITFVSNRMERLLSFRSEPDNKGHTRTESTETHRGASHERQGTATYSTRKSRGIMEVSPLGRVASLGLDGRSPKRHPVQVRRLDRASV
jgi:hypothetical protein